MKIPPAVVRPTESYTHTNPINEERILEIITSNPGCSVKTLMELGGFRDVGVMRSTVYNLKDRGLIHELTGSDPSNMGEIVYRAPNTFKPLPVPGVPVASTKPTTPSKNLDTIKALTTPKLPPVVDYNKYTYTRPVESPMPMPVVSPPPTFNQAQAKPLVPAPVAVDEPEVTPQSELQDQPSCVTPLAVSKHRGGKVKAHADFSDKRVFCISVIGSLGGPFHKRALVYALRPATGNHAVISVDTPAYKLIKSLEYDGYVQVSSLYPMDGSKFFELSAKGRADLPKTKSYLQKAGRVDLYNQIDSAVELYKKAMSGEIVMEFPYSRQGKPDVFKKQIGVSKARNRSNHISTAPLPPVVDTNTPAPVQVSELSSPIPSIQPLPTPPAATPQAPKVPDSTKSVGSYIEGVNWLHKSTLDSAGKPITSNWVYYRTSKAITSFNFFTQTPQTADQYILLDQQGRAELKQTLDTLN